MNRVNKGSQIAAQIANILALVPGGYCAYGTYVLLHGGAPQPSASPPAAAGTHGVNPTVLLVSFVLFLLCFSLAAVLNLLIALRKPKVMRKSDVESRDPRALPATEITAATPQLSRAVVAQIELAGVLRSKAGQAEWLAKELEKVWHIYNNEDAKLIRPLGEHELPDVIQLNRHKRLWAFRIHYQGHIGGVKFHIPDFRSPIVDAPSPYSNIEYLDLLQKLKEHAHLLQKAGQSLESSTVLKA
jgi:hypothetical protein